MNSISSLFNIRYPIIQAGMVWCSGWRLASAVSNAGGLGLIGAGSMNAELLREHIRKCFSATSQPFGVNLPLLYPEIDKLIQVILEEKVKIVFTSAGNPKTWTTMLQAEGIRVVHVVSSIKFALKSEDAGCDAVVAEGFEAGGHNGREETTTFCLIPAVKEAVKIPLIAAGGIGTGRGVFAALALGADGVQVGSRFAASEESSAHPDFKKRILGAKEGDTKLSLKSLTPVRLLSNEFSQKIQSAEVQGASAETLRSMLGKGRARLGMFEGNLEEGELEIGQVAYSINSIMPAGAIVAELWDDFTKHKEAFFKAY